jgi:hypothetical protein
MESKEYLQSIAERVQYYYNIRKRIIKYITENQIAEVSLQVNLLVTGAIWAADRIEDELSEDTLLSVFGLESSSDSYGTKILKLQEDHQELSLIEILDMTVEKY